MIIILNLFHVIYRFLFFRKKLFMNDGLKIDFVKFICGKKRRSKRNLISKERNWILEIGFYCNQ